MDSAASLSLCLSRTLLFPEKPHTLLYQFRTLILLTGNLAPWRAFWRQIYGRLSCQDLRMISDSVQWDSVRQQTLPSLLTYNNKIQNVTKWVHTNSHIGNSHINEGFFLILYLVTWNKMHVGNTSCMVQLYVNRHVK